MVFISYKSEEYEIAGQIRALLEQHHYPCWMAPESIPAGSNYMLEIPKAIRTCDLFILIISEASQKSQWVQKEIDRAVKFNKYILPFHVDDSELSDAIDFVLSNNQRIVAYQNFELAFQELLHAVRMLHPAVQPPAQSLEPENQPEQSQVEETVVVAQEATPAQSPEISQEALLEFLKSLPPEYIAKLFSGQQPTVPVPEPTPEPKPEPTPEPEPEPKPEPKPKPKTETKSEPAPAVSPYADVVPRKDWVAELSEAVRVSLSLEEREDYQRLMTLREEYERLYPQTNLHGFKKSNFLLCGYKPDKQEGGVIVIPFGIKTVGEGVFANQVSIRKVILPPGVQKIQANAFSGCKNLREIVWYEGLLTIESSAFMGCEMLQLVDLPKSLQQIGDFAFFGCENAFVTIGKQVREIGKAACNSCRKVTILEENMRYYMLNNCVVDREKKSVISAAENCTLPLGHSITTVGDCAFQGNDSIVDLVVPGPIKYIGNEAFSRCTCLKSVTIEGGVHTVGERAFAHCTALRSVEIHREVWTVSNEAFLHCKNLSSVTWPPTVKCVVSTAFEGCSRMKRSQIPRQSE